MADSKYSALPPAALLTGAEIFAVDQAGTSVRTTVSAIGNSALGTYTPPGTGAVATTVQAKLQQTVSIFDFMTAAQQSNVSLNIGTIDTTAAIMAAVTYLATFGGGCIHYPAGTYLVGTSGTVTYGSALGTNIYHQGESLEMTVIRNGHASAPAFNIGDGITIFFGGGIEKMRFAGAVGVTGLTGQTAFSINKVGSFRVRDVLITNTGSALYRGAFFNAASQFMVYNLRAQACLSDAITLLNTTDSYITDCRADGNVGSGWFLNGAQGGYFKGCTAYSNTNVGWALISSVPASAPNKNLLFSECVGDTSGNYNWQIADCQDSNFVQCWGSTQQSITVNTSATGFVIYSQYSQRLTFVACVALTNNSHGFNILDTGAAAPTNIELVACQGSSNGVAAGGGNGLLCNNSCNHIRIAGGKYINNVTGSISMGSTQSDIVITGNPVGFVTTNQGTGTIATTATSVAITHGLAFTPTVSNIQLIDTSSKAASGINSAWVSAVGATTFTVTVNAAVAGANYTFAWRASTNGT